jgi:hypothetical protein
MPWWLGDAPEWVIDRVKQIEPIMREHATAVAKEYFDRNVADRAKLARGPAFESMFDVFLNRYAKVDIENFWSPEYSHNVLAHLQIKYAEMVMEAYNPLLLSLSGDRLTP